jgi:hypothetical protein
MTADSPVQVLPTRNGFFAACAQAALEGIPSGHRFRPSFSGGLLGDGISRGLPGWGSRVAVGFGAMTCQDRLPPWERSVHS